MWVEDILRIWLETRLQSKRSGGGTGLVEEDDTEIKEKEEQLYK